MKFLVLLSFVAFAEIVIVSSEESIIDQCVGLMGTVVGLQEMLKSTHFEKGGQPKTAGAVWPQPQKQETEEKFMVLLPDKFSFDTTGLSCEILSSAVTRYHEIIFNPPRLTRINKNPQETLEHSWAKHEKYVGVLHSLKINLLQPCHREWPSDNMNESYSLQVNTKDFPNKAQLSADTIWGILRGLETFSQLVHLDSNGIFLINTTSITDFPRFSYRGLLLDTSRHYLSKKMIFKTLDAMAQNKLNVFHWHMVDNPSFPFKSERFPDLSNEGAYNPQTHVYTISDVSEIVAYARFRGIRVMPEFDTPGHTLSWGSGAPGLLTQCYKNVDGNLVPDGLGPIDPSKESTYEFLRELFDEVLGAFPDSLLHLGGDEVFHECWKSNPDILEFMKEKGFDSDFAKLENYYLQRLQEVITTLQRNSSYVVWEEASEMGDGLNRDTIVQVWKTPFYDSLSTVTKKGYRTILSSCWYLNYITYGTDWMAYYLCDPQMFFGDETQMKLILGGEVCMWGEYVDATNLESILWPRACAPAERLWSHSSINDMHSAAPRLEEHRCRMIARGFDAQPQNGPSYCHDDF